jgi:hypothetical protein
MLETKLMSPRRTAEAYTKRVPPSNRYVNSRDPGSAIWQENRERREEREERGGGDERGAREVAPRQPKSPNGLPFTTLRSLSLYL